MELAYTLIGLVILIMAILAFLMTLFIYQIKGNADKIAKKADEQLAYLKCHLEAQNKMLKILWDIQHKN